jgi:hypothetical protein
VHDISAVIAGDAGVALGPVLDDIARVGDVVDLVERDHLVAARAERRELLALLLIGLQQRARRRQPRDVQDERDRDQGHQHPDVHPAQRLALARGQPSGDGVGRDVIERNLRGFCRDLARRELFAHAATNGAVGEVTATVSHR